GAGVEVPRVAGQRTGTVGGDQHAVADPVASVARHVDPRLVGDDHARLQQGRVAVLQPRRLVHAEPDPVSLSVPQVLPEAGVADHVQTGPVGLAALHAGPDRRATDALGLFDHAVVAVLLRARFAEYERPLALDEPATDGAPQRQHERVAGAEPVAAGQPVRVGTVRPGVDQAAGQHR